MDNFAILIVDDDPVNLEIVSARLSKLGYVPHEAENGKRALAYIHRQRFDVVITDLMMPEADDGKNRGLSSIVHRHDVRLSGGII